MTFNAYNEFICSIGRFLDNVNKARIEVKNMFTVDKYRTFILINNEKITDVKEYSNDKFSQCDFAYSKYKRRNFNEETNRFEIRGYHYHICYYKKDENTRE